MSKENRRTSRGLPVHAHARPRHTRHTYARVFKIEQDACVHMNNPLVSQVCENMSEKIPPPPCACGSWCVCVVMSVCRDGCVS